MDFYCEECDKLIKSNSKYKPLKSNIHKEFENCKHIELTIENPNINIIDEIFYAYIIEYNKKYDYYVIKCHFELVFNDNQYRIYVRSSSFDNKTMVSWKNFLEK